LGYTLYRNVYPYPSGDAYWFPIVGGAWLVASIIGVLVAPGTARRLGAALAAREGIAGTAPEGPPQSGLVFPGHWTAAGDPCRYPSVPGVPAPARSSPQLAEPVPHCIQCSGLVGCPCGRSRAFPDTDVKRRGLRGGEGHRGVRMERADWLEGR